MKTIELGHTAKIRYSPEDEIITIIYSQNIVVDEKIVREVVKSAVDIADSETFGLLIDISKVLYITKEARALSTELEKDKINSLAIVLQDAIHRELFNIFQTFNRPPYPTKAFTDLDKAYQWLKEQNKVERI